MSRCAGRTHSIRLQNGKRAAAQLRIHKHRHTLKSTSEFKQKNWRQHKPREDTCSQTARPLDVAHGFGQTLVLLAQQFWHSTTRRRGGGDRRIGRDAKAACNERSLCISMLGCARSSLRTCSIFCNLRPRHIACNPSRIAVQCRPPRLPGRMIERMHHCQHGIYVTQIY